MKSIRFVLISVISIAFYVPRESFATKNVPILMYHYIRDCNCPKDPFGMKLSVSPSNFDAQMNYLSSHGYTPITLDTLAAAYANKTKAPEKPVVITFDDGYSDFYSNAYPILKRYNFHAVAFIPTGLIGTGGYMNWDNIKDLQKSGLVSFEGHTITHAYLPKLSSKTLIHELQESKTVLQNETGTMVNFIAYPFGASNGTVIKAAQKAGYVGGVGTWYGKASGINMNMPRVRVNGEFSLNLFISRL